MKYTERPWAGLMPGQGPVVVSYERRNEHFRSTKRGSFFDEFLASHDGLCSMELAAVLSVP
jgi:hypothetical protein